MSKQRNAGGWQSGYGTGSGKVGMFPHGFKF